MPIYFVAMGFMPGFTEPRRIAIGKPQLPAVGQKWVEAIICCG